MPMPVLIALIVQSLIFVAWAGQMFWNLFSIRQIGRGPRYLGQPGLTATLDSFRLFLTAPEWRRRRNWLGLTTLALLLAQAAFTQIAFRFGDMPDAL